MITRDDMKALGPVVIKLNTERKDWRDHLDKIVRLGDVGTLVVYWKGPTDVDPRGIRKQVFKAIRDHYEAGRVELYQRNAGDGVRSYIAEVRR